MNTQWLQEFDVFPVCITFLAFLFIVWLFFAICTGNVETIDDVMPEEGERE